MTPAVPLRCMDFVGYIVHPSGARTGKLIFKAVYTRSDPEVTRLTISILIEGSTVFTKTYDVTTDSLEINEEISVEWRWGVSKCPVYIGEMVSMPRASGVVVVATSETVSAVVNSLEASCSAIVPSGGSLAGIVARSDEPVYVTGGPAIYNCGNALESGGGAPVKVLVTVQECNDRGVCVSWDKGLLLYAVAPEARAPEARLVNVLVAPA